MHRSRALVLDFDGTILDSEWPIFQATNDLYAEFGMDAVPLDEWRETIGVADHEMHHDYLGRVVERHPGETRAAGRRRDAARP